MNRKFDYGKWKAKLLSAPSYYDVFHKYVSDEKALLLHINSHTFWSGNESGDIFQGKVNELSEDIRKLITDHFSNELTRTLRMFSKQLIVVAASYVEGMINEFFQSLFHKHPERMYSYLGQNTKSSTGCIPFKLVLESTDKEKLIYKVVNHACVVASSGKMQSKLKRIEQLGKKELDSDLKEELERLIRLRNEIVHEQYEPQIEKRDVSAAFEVADKLLDSCSVILLKNKVPVDDPTGKLNID